MRNKCKLCGSYQFNLYHDGVDQKELCDVHYWQVRALKAEGLETLEREVKRLLALGWTQATFAQALKDFFFNSDSRTL